MSHPWLTEVARIYLALSFLSALIVAADVIFGRRQEMKIMNAVWPITAIWAGPFGLLAYRLFGRPNRGHHEKPFWQSVLIGDTHCAAGCTIGDFCGEWLVFATGFTLAGSALWADYFFDFVLAYAFGILFQYFSIAPMRHLTGWAGIKAALKADTISLVAFEVGMFAWMALSHHRLHHPGLEADTAAYWFNMQIAMFIGFITAYPANWWLIRTGIKEGM